MVYFFSHLLARTHSHSQRAFYSYTGDCCVSVWTCAWACSKSVQTLLKARGGERECRRTSIKMHGKCTGFGILNTFNCYANTHTSIEAHTSVPSENRVNTVHWTHTHSGDCNDVNEYFIIDFFFCKKMTNAVPLQGNLYILDVGMCVLVRLCAGAIILTLKLYFRITNINSCDGIDTRQAHTEHRHAIGSILYRLMTADWEENTSI